MKIKCKFNPTCLAFFYLIVMNIRTEIDKLNGFVNYEVIPSFKKYESLCKFSKLDAKVKIEYLLYVLELTYNHPEIEIYLKQLLENFNIAELNNFSNDDYTVLHWMIYKLSNISLNSFEIIINFGINVNSQTIDGYAPLHHTLCVTTEHYQNIIGLFVKHGADLNILNRRNKTVLDEFIYCRKLKHSKNIIMTLIEFGAKTNNPHSHTNDNVLEFIESYRSSSIKPAIKK